MSVKLSESQMTTLKSMIDIAENISDQFLHIMRNSGLDKIPGCDLWIHVQPELDFLTEHIQFGHLNADTGKINLGKGKYDERFSPFGKNSAEYELLFADDTIRAAIKKILDIKKPLPPDGLWIGNSDNEPPLDCRGNVINFDDLEPGKVGGV